MQGEISSAIKKYWFMFLPAQLLLSSYKYIEYTILQLVLYIITLIFMFLYLQRKYPEVFQNKQRPSFKNVIEIVMLMWLGRILTGILSLIINMFFPINTEGILSGFSWWDQFYLAILVAPFLEESYFRGIALHAMLPLGVTNAFIVNSLIFSLAHSGLPNIFNAFIVGFLFTYAAYKYGIIWSVFFHALGNAFSLFLSYVIINDRVIFTLGSQNVLFTRLLTFVLLLVTIYCLIYFWRKIRKNQHDLKGFWAEYKPNRAQLVEILKNKWMLWYVILHLIGTVLSVLVLSGLIS